MNNIIFFGAVMNNGTNKGETNIYTEKFEDWIEWIIENNNETNRNKIMILEIVDADFDNEPIEHYHFNIK